MKSKKGTGGKRWKGARKRGGRGKKKWPPVRALHKILIINTELFTV
jgi:hypothetical protein